MGKIRFWGGWWALLCCCVVVLLGAVAPFVVSGSRATKSPHARFPQSSRGGFGSSPGDPFALDTKGCVLYTLCRGWDISTEFRRSCAMYRKFYHRRQNMSTQTYARRRLGAFARRLYTLSRDAQDVIDTSTPYEERLYGETLQVIADATISLYFKAMEDLRK